MSIQSTVNINHEYAIERIKEIHAIIQAKNYRELENKSFEPNMNIQAFVDNFTIDISNIEKWTDKMLEDVMDKPFFRQSMFDNYLVGKDE